MRRLSALPLTRARHSGGFTLIELMIALVVAGVLAAVALPAYSGFVKKSRARDAGADLAALALNMENSFQLQLAYPVNAANTVASTSTFSAWSPTQASHFSYTLVSTANSYTLTATGKSSLEGCVMTLNQASTRSASSACGFTTW
nr:type IV pilin protein [uncultured Roseateles sp.]